MHGPMICCLVWFICGTWPWITDAAFLKSKGDVKVLEGHELELDWTAYYEGDRVPPCSWLYAPNKTQMEIDILAFAEGKRHTFDHGEEWQFSNADEPCVGGIKKNASPEDSGLYMMKVKSGYRLKDEDRQTEVQIYRGSDLKFTVTVNDKVSNLDLSKGPNLVLDQLQTDRPVNVAVAISKAFPPTRVTIARGVNEAVCEHPYDGCSTEMNLMSQTDTSIVIKMETGILGVEQVMISQPVLYNMPRNKVAQAAAIAFSVLCCILLSFIIAGVVLLIKKNRKECKKLDIEKADVPEKSTLRRIVKNKSEELFNDIKAAFTAGGRASLELRKITKKCTEEINQAREENNNQQGEYNRRKQETLNLISQETSTIRNLLEKVQKCLTEMEGTKTKMKNKKSRDELNQAEHEQYVVCKLCIESAEEKTGTLHSFQHDLKSYEDGIYVIDEELRSLLNEVESMEVTEEDDPSEEESKETESLNNGKQETVQKGTVLVQRIYSQSKEITALHKIRVTLQSMLRELDRITAGIQNMKQKLVDLDSKITTLTDKYDKLKKGWRYNERKTNVEMKPFADSSTEKEHKMKHMEIEAGNSAGESKWKRFKKHYKSIFSRK